MNIPPELKWERFADCNDNATDAFEEMCRRLFIEEYLKGQVIPHSNANNKGIEVLPVEEPERIDGQPRKLISFQSKYAKTPDSAYQLFKHSAKVTAKEYKGKLDLVYLFSNQTLSTDSKAYLKIVEIHKNAGMDVLPVSNTDLLDLIRKHPNIANDYFSFKASLVQPTIIPTSLPGITIQQETGNIVISPEAFQPKSKSEKLLHGLIREKIKICQKYAFAMEIDALRQELEVLSEYDASGTDGVQELCLLQLLMGLYDGKDVSPYAEKCNNLSTVRWLIDFYAYPHEIEKAEFLRLDAIMQIFVADKMFTSMLWKEFAKLYNDLDGQIDSSIRKQLNLYYGLTLFNLQESREAKKVLHELYDLEREDRFLFYAVCADIKMHNDFYQSGLDGNAEELRSLLDQLIQFKELKHYKQQGVMVAALMMEAYYHLGVCADNTFIEKAIETYTGYPEEIRNHKAVMFYYALCLEMNGNRTAAIDVYSRLDWKNEPAFTERYMLCHILNDQPKKAIEIYNILPSKNIRIDSVYLLALNKTNDASYKKELQKAIDSHKDDLEAIFNISYFIDSETADKEIVLPWLKKLITENGIDALRQAQAIQLAVLLAHFGDIELLDILLGLIGDVKEFSSFAYNEIYRGIVKVANREYIKQGTEFEKLTDFNAAEHIADMMLTNIVRGQNDRHDSIRAKFLNVKVMCAGVRKLPYSSLKYSEELFSINGRKDIARNIVGLLVDRKETDPDKYAPYIDVLEHSNNPDYCMIVAAAMLLMRKEDSADYYAYKALYLLNGEDDYNIYKSYFNYCNYNMHWLRKDYQLRNVSNGTVVSLVETETDGTPNSLTICLDNEPDFTEMDNRSMNVEHLTPKSTDYFKLRGCGLNQIRSFRGKKYKIFQIMTRTQYGLNYVYSKIQEKPDMFKGVAWMINTEDVEALVQQMKELDDERKIHLKSLIDSYNYVDNPMGLPIDSLTMGDINRYIEAFRYFLYAKDEAFFAGQPVYEDEGNQAYVLTLSTLVLLALLNRFDVLDAIRDNIIIPESYIAFLTERYEHAYTTDPESRSTLLFVEGKPVLQDMDIKIPEYWERILDYCRGCKTHHVDNDERINLQITDGCSGEKLITGFRLSSIHLDSLILAKREGATYLCDDLFFRKIASNIGIRNINTVSIVAHYEDDDAVTSFILELSKTNYIYLPLVAKNDQQAKELINNLLDGEKKKKYYTEIIYRMQIIREKFMRELYGDEYVDKLLEQDSIDT